MTDADSRNAREDTAVPMGAIGRFRLVEGALRGDPQRWARLWRGAVASRFGDDAAFHGHEEGRTLYRHPPVQYRWSEGVPSVLVLGDASERAMTASWPGTALRLGDREVRVAEVTWEPVSLRVEVSPRLERYAFRAPWLALNQENYARFKAMGGAEQRAELDRILVGNLLALCTGVGVRLPEGVRLYAAAEPTELVPCRLKGVELLGIAGSFVANLHLPDHLAVGKSVSHGYGWFTRDRSSLSG